MSSQSHTHTQEFIMRGAREYAILVQNSDWSDGWLESDNPHYWGKRAWNNWTFACAELRAYVCRMLDLWTEQGKTVHYNGSDYLSIIGETSAVNYWVTSRYYQ